MQLLKVQYDRVTKTKSRSNHSVFVNLHEGDFNSIETANLAVKCALVKTFLHNLSKPLLSEKTLKKLAEAMSK